MPGGAPAISRERRAAAELDERQQPWQHKACDLVAARARPISKPPAEHAICERYPPGEILYVPLPRGTSRRALAVPATAKLARCGSRGLGGTYPYRGKATRAMAARLIVARPLEGGCLSPYSQATRTTWSRSGGSYTGMIQALELSTIATIPGSLA